MIVFIPIKHNSQRVPGKNFRLFNGEPLFRHTLLKYKDHNVYVDTDSDELLSQINNDQELKHVVCYKRRMELVGDMVSVCDLLNNFIQSYNITVPIAQIHVTSPFLSVDTVESAYKKIKNNQFDSVASCTVYNSRFWRKENYGFCPINHNPVKLEQTQDLPKFYEENSAFYIFKPKVILELNSRIGRHPHFYPIDKIQSIDIDTEDDWNFAVKMNGVF
jgi:CMP-N-acetylneuraminic acid synthetase